MRQVVVVIRTTGPAPMHGARVDELAAVELADGHQGDVLHFRIAAGEDAQEAGRVPFSEAYSALTTLIGSSQLVAHDIEVLNRFLRAECKRSGLIHTIKRKHPVVDTWLLAKQRFPRQRHDLDAVAKKLNVSASKDAVGVARDLQLLVGVAAKLNMKQDEKPPEVTVPAVTSIPEIAAAPPALLPVRSFGEKLDLCWRVLVGKA